MFRKDCRMDRVSDDEAAAVLARWLGGTQPELLGAGMEGTVYAIDDERVAKVWHSGSAGALDRTMAFYRTLGRKTFGFAVPGILSVERAGDRVVSIERRLTGRPFPADDGYDVVVDVLAELAVSGPLPEARDLSLLGEDDPLYTAGDDFPAALARLVERRVERFRHVLGRSVDDLGAKAAAVAARLRDVDSGRRAVIHGDLIPANILVDDTGRPSAVLDWGFLTTEGDPAFDAAIAAAIYDMYGPDATRIEQDLLGRIEARLGYQHDALLIYRAAYSLITANAYDVNGQDGHFAWCVAALHRADVTRALLG
jgi:Ser/Thr protein kinase RdoA (MazF antagonist)